LRRELPGYSFVVHCPGGWVLCSQDYNVGGAVIIITYAKKAHLPVETLDHVQHELHPII